jgi:hypothetical protein
MSVQKIASGQFKGYYSLPGSLDRQPVTKNTYVPYEKKMRELAGARGIAWYKYSPGPNKTIKGFNKQYLPRYGGYYYVARNPSIDLRRQLYALENLLVPADGNTETFNLELNKVVVPSDWCPYYLDPCTTEWCLKCRNKPPPVVAATPATKTAAVVPVQQKTMRREVKRDWLPFILKWACLAAFAAALAVVLTAVVVS